MKSEFQELLLTSALTVGVTIIGLFLRWLATKVNASEGVKEFFIYIEGYGSRLRDKYLIELKAAKDPSSAGGVEVTPEEISALRQKIYDDMMNELKGPAKDYALKLGAEAVKGLLGKFISKGSDK